MPGECYQMAMEKGQQKKEPPYEKVKVSITECKQNYRACRSHYHQAAFSEARAPGSRVFDDGMPNADIFRSRKLGASRQRDAWDCSFNACCPCLIHGSNRRL